MVTEEIYQPIFEKIPELKTQNQSLTQTNQELKTQNQSNRGDTTMDKKNFLKQIWDGLPGKVQGFIAIGALLGGCLVGGWLAYNYFFDPSQRVGTNSRTDKSNNLQKYTVNVKVDGQQTGGIEVKYQLDGSGNERSITTESGGAKVFHIPRTTESIFFVVTDEKYEGNGHKGTAQLDNPTTASSYTILLKAKKQTVSPRSSTDNLKVKSIKITVKKKIEDGGGIVPDATVTLTGTKITGRFRERTNSEGIVEWDEVHIDGNAPQLQINDKVTVEIIKEGWKVENPNLPITQSDYVDEITLIRK